MAEQAKHTAGPWTACGNGNCSCGSVNSEHHPVATVVSGDWGDTWPDIRTGEDGKSEAYLRRADYGTVPWGEARANARLIAAAPDLYRELDAVEWAGDRLYNQPTCPACGGIQPGYVDRGETGPVVYPGDHVGHSPGCTLAAALAKADGR